MSAEGPVWDAVVAGAGIAGAAAALAMKHALGPAGQVLLCDPNMVSEASGKQRTSLRAVAIAPDVRRFLEDLGVWAAVAENAQPIVAMTITDGRPGRLPHQAYLSFDDLRAEPLAHMVFAVDLRRALVAACAERGIETDISACTGLRADAWSMAVTTAGDHRHRARLAVAADGGGSRLRHAARIQVLDRPYSQAAIVATLRHHEDHAGRAVQHFLPAGPIALLPMRDDDGARRRVSLVWTEARGEADRLVALPPDLFCAALEERIGRRLGRLTLEDKPQSHPLRMQVARRMTAERFALVGDAARIIHPLAGQGLNLGLRDAAALAEAVETAATLGLDPGSGDTLARFERSRLGGSWAMAGGTDLLDRLFSTDQPLIRGVRDFGLRLVDRSPALKRRFADQAGAEPSRSAPITDRSGPSSTSAL